MSESGLPGRTALRHLVLVLLIDTSRSVISLEAVSCRLNCRIRFDARVALRGSRFEASLCCRYAWLNFLVLDGYPRVCLLRLVDGWIGDT